MLSKARVYEGEGKVYQAERIHILQERVFKKIKQFASIDPNFASSDLPDVAGVENQEKIELVKQCFFLNIYNSIVLFKLAEIGSFRGVQLFNFKNINSWIALEQNSLINIKSQVLTAYQIRTIILSGRQLPQSNEFIVDSQYLHPLIDFGLFLPKSCGMTLSCLFFTSAEYLKFKFSEQVREMLVKKIRVKESYSVIMLPHCLKQSLMQIKKEEKPNQSSTFHTMK